MKTWPALTFFVLVLILVMVPNHVVALTQFPEDGATLTYATLESSETSKGNITAALTDSYSFQQLGNEWNVTETLKGRINCSPSQAQLSVTFRTISDIMGRNSIASTNPNIDIIVSYLILDRLVESTSVGTNAPAGYFAKCTLGGIEIAEVSQATPALYASGFKYYVIFYIQPAGLGVGSSVSVATMSSTVSGTQNIMEQGVSRLALVGAVTGITGGLLYWDRETGILLLEQGESGTQSERMSLTSSSIPVPEFQFAQVTAVVAMAMVFAVRRKRFILGK